MLRHDGGSEESDRPVVNLVRFGTVEQDLLESLARSVEGFLRFIGEEGIVQPTVLRSRRCLPAGLPDQYQGTFLLSHLESVPGNIAVGVTDIVFYDPNLPRRVFGYGSGGRSIISTFRFRRESDNRRILYERLNKEIIKILSMACDLPICSDRQCIVMYHRFMEDIDKNTTVCPTCRQKFVKSLEWYLGAKNHG
jgi:predicted Zn-dependent protease